MGNTKRKPRGASFYTELVLIKLSEFEIVLNFFDTFDPMPPTMAIETTAMRASNKAHGVTALRWGDDGGVTALGASARGMPMAGDLNMGKKKELQGAPF